MRIRAPEYCVPMPVKYSLSEVYAMCPRVAVSILKPTAFGSVCFACVAVTCRFWMLNSVPGFASTSCSGIC